MGKKREVTYFNDRYKGSLTEQECNNLETLIELDKNNGVIPDLKHIIFNMRDEDVLSIIQDYKEEGLTFKKYDRPVGTLRDEQTIGVSFMYNSRCCILGDSVGMGKTVQVAGLCNLLKLEYNNRGIEFRYLLLTEKNISSQIRMEMIKFTGDYTILLSDSMKKTVGNFISENPYDEMIENNVVGTHNLLTSTEFLAWLERYKARNKKYPFDCLIIDESSVLGGKAKTIISAFKEIRKNFDRIIFLNATPFETKLEIFYNQLALLDSSMLPTKKNFQSRYYIYNYTGMYPKFTGKYKNQEEFKRLIGYRYFARTRKDKGAKMEDCKGGILYSDLSPIQKEWLRKSSMNKIIYDCPNYIDESIAFNKTNVPKLKDLDNLLQNECKDAKTVLIFSHFKEAQKSLSDWLTNKGYTNKVLNGETKNSDRADIVRGFKNAEFRVLITNVQKGLNFGSCNHCIFYSFDPNPSKMIQFEGRTTRDFDIMGKNVYILCSNGREKKELLDIVGMRAKATADMTNVDLSVVMSILLEGELDD